MQFRKRISITRFGSRNLRVQLFGIPRSRDALFLNFLKKEQQVGHATCFIFIVAEMTILIEEGEYMVQNSPNPRKKDEFSFDITCF